MYSIISKEGHVHNKLSTVANKRVALQPVKKTDTHLFQILVAIFLLNKKIKLFHWVKYISQRVLILVRLLLLKKTGELHRDSK